MRLRSNAGRRLEGGAAAGDSSPVPSKASHAALSLTARSARSAMPKRKRTSAEAKQGAQFRDLPESIVKGHLLPFLCHESWYNRHQFCFEQLRGVVTHMLDRGSWKHAAFQWAEDVYHLAGTNRAMWKALGRVSLGGLMTATPSFWATRSASSGRF